jgi:hypothetical protein
VQLEAEKHKLVNRGVMHVRCGSRSKKYRGEGRICRVSHTFLSPPHAFHSECENERASKEAASHYFRACCKTQHDTQGTNLRHVMQYLIKLDAHKITSQRERTQAQDLARDNLSSSTRGRPLSTKIRSRAGMRMISRDHALTCHQRGRTGGVGNKGILNRAHKPFAQP